MAVVAANLPNHEPLTKAKHRPCREHHHVRHTLKMADQRNKCVNELHAGENAQRFTHTQSAPLQNVVKMITSRREG